MENEKLENSSSQFSKEDLRQNSDVLKRLLRSHEVIPGEYFFYKQIDKFPKEAQEFISSMSSALLEGDIYNTYAKDPEKIKAVRSGLLNTGLQVDDIKIVLDYFRLKSPEEKPETG